MENARTNARTSIPEGIIFNRLTIASRFSGLLLLAHYSLLFTSLFTFSSFPYTYIQIHTYMNTHIYVRTGTHIYMNTNTRTPYTYRHTHIQLYFYTTINISTSLTELTHNTV